MKIVRLQNHYRIHLTNSEFAALEDLMARGFGEVETLDANDWRDLPRAVRRGLRALGSRKGHTFDDRRK